MNKVKYAAIMLLITLLLFSCSTTETTTTAEIITPIVEEKAEEIVIATPAIEEAEIVSEHFITSISKYGNCMTNLDFETLAKEGVEYGDVFTVTIGSITFEAPVVSAYSDVDLGKPLIKATENGIELAINMGSLANQAGIKEGAEFSFELTGKGQYADEYMIRHLVRSEDRTDYATDEIFANFREVNTTGISANKLYRSCSPILPETTRSPYAYSLMEQAGIEAVINLSNSKEEVEEYAASYPLYEQLYNEGKVIALNMGVDYNDPEFTAKLKEGLLFLAEQETPILIHCNEGKDRAGFTVALIEALAGASTDEIIEDYVKSFENYYNIEKGSEQYEKIASIIVDFFTTINGGKSVGQKPLNATVSYLKNTVGLSTNDLTTIRLMLRY